MNNILCYSFLKYIQFNYITNPVFLVGVFKLMASSSTSEEIEIINNIKEGTQKLIENILLDEIESPKEYANRKAHTKIRPSTHTFLIHDIIQIFRTDRNYIFRLIDLKKRLPDRLKVIEDYDSELTRIIQSLVCSNLIVHSSRLPTKKRSRTSEET